MVAARLGTVFAVFTAAAAAAVDDRAKVDVVAAETFLYLAGTLLQLFQVAVKEDGEVIAALYAVAVDDFFSEFRDGHCHLNSLAFI